MNILTLPKKDQIQVLRKAFEYHALNLGYKSYRDAVINAPDDIFETLLDKVIEACYEGVSPFRRAVRAKKVQIFRERVKTDPVFRDKYLTVIRHPHNMITNKTRYVFNFTDEPRTVHVFKSGFAGVYHVVSEAPFDNNYYFLTAEAIEEDFGITLPE